MNNPTSTIELLHTALATWGYKFSLIDYRWYNKGWKTLDDETVYEIAWAMDQIGGTKKIKHQLTEAEKERLRSEWQRR